MVNPPFHLFSLIAVGLLASCTSLQKSRDTPRYVLGGATSEMIAQILPVVRAHTKDPIIQIEKTSDGTVEVQVGELVPFQSGHGHWYQLKKRDGRWQIVADGVWIV
jgi:hypothetical protein